MDPEVCREPCLPCRARWLAWLALDTSLVSTATLVVALAAQPVIAPMDGHDVLEALAQTTGSEPIQVILRSKNNGPIAEAFAAKSPGSVLIVTGDLSLDDQGNTAVVFLRSHCDAAADQYLNEVTIVGRLSGECKTAESGKSVARSCAVSRWNGERERTDWFKLRGFGYAKDKLEGAPKGGLVCATGALEQRTNREGQPYTEVKVRALRVHGRGGSGNTRNPAAGTKASGYTHEDFAGGADDMPFHWS